MGVDIGSRGQARRVTEAAAEAGVGGHTLAAHQQHARGQGGQRSVLLLLGAESS